jgi:hypothetical protein
LQHRLLARFCVVKLLVEDGVGVGDRGAVEDALKDVDTGEASEVGIATLQTAGQVSSIINY